ncbi:MAG: iron-containing alcohol dehydrogenase [Clostridiales bacterium]|nr:iron-containing alcohol dehydrogenase [Clostridiales bacterium]
MGTAEYLKYAREAKYEPQKLYLESGDSFALSEAFREMGTRRILFLGNPVTSKYKIFNDLIDFYGKEGFRCFRYVRSENWLTDTEVFNCLKIYNEFNCDTIITVGGTADIDCGKLTAAAAINPVKALSDFEGIDKLKKDISVLCCIVTDNSSSPATSFAEFKDSTTGKWTLCMSNYFIPQVVVVDTDLSVRTEIAWALESSFNALASSVEVYINPASTFNPAYRANAVNACISIFTNIKKIKDDPDDPYARRLVSVGGIYSGTASGMFGLGYNHLITHHLISRFGVAYGSYHIVLLSCALTLFGNRITGSLATLARELHLCTAAAGDESAASTFIDGFKRIADMSVKELPLVELTEQEILRIAEDVRKEAVQFGLTMLDQREITSIMNMAFAR